MKEHSRDIPALALTLISVALLTVSAIIVTNGLMPEGTPAATPNLTDWISAVGQAVGAVGTAGALWLGAITFRRQVRDQHRAQAAAATVMVTRYGRLARVVLHNGSLLPLYDIKLVATYPNGDLESQKFFVVPPQTPIELVEWEFEEGMSGHAEFQDSADRRWRRHLTGELEEIK